MMPIIVQRWLLLCLGMVFSMIIIGAITRLTDSGLSMVEWRPIYGFLPPLSEAEWQRIFELYQFIPEYQYQNSHMGLEEFKSIFWWEYFHRVWGRLIGVIYGLPLLIFWLRGMLPQKWKLPLFLLFILGGCQGLIGWWMVKSGLVENLDVSAFRLMVHLGIALIILMLLWVCFFLGKQQNVSRETNTTSFWRGFVVFIWLLSFLTVLSGALVAGNDAGLVYNDWPLMNGDFMPDAYSGGSVEAWMFDQATVQFHHRLLAYALAFCVFLLVWQRDNAANSARWVVLLATIVIVQIVLGIVTLMHVAPIELAVVHHVNALFLLLTATHLMITELYGV